MLGRNKKADEPIYDYVAELMQAYKKADPRLYAAVQECQNIDKQIRQAKTGYQNSKDYLELDNSSSGPAKAARRIISEYGNNLSQLEIELDDAEKRLKAIIDTIPKATMDEVDRLDDLLYVAAGIKNKFIEYSGKYIQGMPSRHKNLLYVGYMGVYLALFRALYRNTDFYYDPIEKRVRQLLRMNFRDQIGLNSTDYKVIVDYYDGFVNQMDAMMIRGAPVKANIILVKSLLSSKRINEIDDAFCMVFSAGINDCSERFHEVYE